MAKGRKEAKATPQTQPENAPQATNQGGRPRVPISEWEILLGGIASGLTNRDACTLAGIGESTFYEKQKDDPEFAERVKRALVQFKHERIKKIREDTSWQSSAWLLERKFPEEFGRKDQVDHTTKGEKINTIRLIEVRASDTKTEPGPDLLEG